MEHVHINLGDRSYDIKVEAGALSRLGEFVKECYFGRGKVAVVTTGPVAELYLDTAVSSLDSAGYEVVTVIMPDGEEEKTLANYEVLLTRLIKARFERSSLVIPLGGGVIGDMAGFAAATLLRGVPLLQAPTTIVAQVDSSIGGKVAVDHPLGKNLVGSFYQPKGVLIDTRVLATLPPREVVSGMAEVVKHAVIRDEKLLSFLEGTIESLMSFQAGDEQMEHLIAWNCRIKAAVVDADEREHGVRAHLNYGHTVGHALETVTGYTRFRHGEAVILGMIAAAEIAVKKGLFPPADRDRQNRLLSRVGVRNDLSGINSDEIINAMKKDKKVSGGVVRFVLPRAISDVAVYNDVNEVDVRAGLNAMFEYAADAK